MFDPHGVIDDQQLARVGWRPHEHISLATAAVTACQIVCMSVRPARRHDVFTPINKSV